MRKGSECNEKSAEVYQFWLSGHTQGEAAMFFGLSKETTSNYIRREREADARAAAEGRTRSVRLREPVAQSKGRYMSDEDMRREYRLAKDKLRQIAIIAQLNDISPRAVAKIVSAES